MQITAYISYEHCVQHDNMLYPLPSPNLVQKQLLPQLTTHCPPNTLSSHRPNKFQNVRRRRRTHKGDAVLVQQLGQLWVLGGVTPARPDGLHLGPQRDVQDQVDVGVVVVVRAARNRYKLVGQPDVLCTNQKR